MEVIGLTRAGKLALFESEVAIGWGTKARRGGSHREIEATPERVLELRSIANPSQYLF